VGGGCKCDTSATLSLLALDKRPAALQSDAPPLLTAHRRSYAACMEPPPGPGTLRSKDGQKTCCMGRTVCCEGGGRSPYSDRLAQGVVPVRSGCCRGCNLSISPSPMAGVLGGGAPGAKGQAVKLLHVDAVLWVGHHMPVQSPVVACSCCPSNERNTRAITGSSGCIITALTPCVLS
jgi:hypothetical protein